MRAQDFDIAVDLHEAAYVGNIGMMEMYRFYQIATDREKAQMKLLIAAGEQEKAWELLKKVTGSRLKEAESGTEQAREISKTLRNAGYRMIGSGADATVWAQTTGNVVKIIMPEEGATDSAEAFKRFYEFASQHQKLANMPKFLDLGANGPSTFTIGGREYQLVAMERLTPIPSGSFAEAMTWILSDLATRGINWDRALKEILDPETWQQYDGGMQPAEILNRIKNLDTKQLLEYEILFKTMTLLYHTGRINRYGWDLHTENAMMRGDTIVITDPWFSINT